MDSNSDILKRLDSISFKSLDKAGINWKKLIKDSPSLQKEYANYLSLKSDYIVVNIDFSQIESYVLASLSRDAGMVSMVNSGADIHSENTKKLTGVDYLLLDKQEREYKKKFGENHSEYLNILASIKAFKAKRKTVKAFTFSLSYGAGAGKIAMDLGITMVEAQKLIDDFYKVYPGVKKWQNDLFMKAIEIGYIETPFGRRRAMDRVKGRLDAYRALAEERPKDISALKKLGEYWSLREEYKQVINTNIQSTATDMCSLAACRVKEWLKTCGLRAELYFWVHDSLVLGVHIDDAVAVIEYVMDMMENKVKYPGDPVNYRTALDVGYNYEWAIEISRDEWLSSNKRELLDRKLKESLELDINKKFKLIVKSNSFTIDDTYLKKIRDAKESYFELLVERLNIAGVHNPKEYVCMMNGCSEDEYNDAMDLDDLDGPTE